MERSSSQSLLTNLLLICCVVSVAHAAFSPTCNNFGSTRVKVNNSLLTCKAIIKSQCRLVDQRTNKKVFQVCQLQCPQQSKCVTGGQLTMWTTSPTTVQGSSCEYASSTAISGGATPWLINYVNPGMYCAVSDDLYESGVTCGSCYRVSYSGSGGSDPGKAGSAVIQVVDSGAGGSKHFDCYLTAHQAISGANTGVFPVAYAKVNCKRSPLAAVVLDGNNAYYTKVLFAGGVTGVKAARITIGTVTTQMYKVSGATWAASLTGATNKAVSFQLTFSDGTMGSISGCFGSNTWPVATGTQCVMPV
ncbi:hypothetical protein MPSEU_000872400 [Mayamaea pseudoterrestris]|nr:hypothetical protein MPSEU_000872400 [Mayamaea pseudoterrestris]